MHAKPNARLEQLRRAGVSIWLDTLSRELLASGEFSELVRDYAVTGATSNPTIFAKAITGSDRYDDQLRSLASKGPPDTRELFFDIALDDVRSAAAILRPVHERTGGGDGFISFECTPDLADDTEGTIAQALDLWQRLDLPDVLIKVPATAAGVDAIEELTARGVNVNVTLLFSVERYEEVIEAYLRGLERRVAAGEPIDGISSVASFFVSRVDAKADAALPADSSLRGQVAIANAHVAYGRYLRPLRRGALDGARGARRPAPTPALGEHRDQGPQLPRRPLCGEADRSGRDQHDARANPARVRRPRQRRARSRRRPRRGASDPLRRRRGGRRPEDDHWRAGARGRKGLLRLLRAAARLHRIQARLTDGHVVGGRPLHRRRKKARAGDVKHG